MSRSKSLIAITLALVALMSVGVAQAAEGRIKIHSLASGPPFTINNPGHYILTKNINLTGGSAIIVNSDCVELNLNGKSIVSTGPGNLIDVVAGRSDVSIHNGWLTGGSIGINYFSGGARTRMRIRDVEMRAMGQNGIRIFGAENVELVANQITDITGDGIYVDGNNNSFTGRFVENTVHLVDGNGIFIEGLEGGDVIRNVVRRFGLSTGFAGLWLSGQTTAFVGGNLIQGNTVSFGSAHGIAIGDGSQNNQVLENVIYENTGIGLGLYSSDGNQVKRNTIGNNGGDGIMINATGRNLLDANEIDTNGGDGIRFMFATANNVCRNNVVQNNSGAAWSGNPQVDLGGNYANPPVSGPTNLCQ